MADNLTRLINYNVFEDPKKLVTFVDPLKVIDANWITSANFEESKNIPNGFSRGRFYSFGDSLIGNSRLGFSRSLNPYPGIGLYIDKPAMNRAKMTKTKDANGKTVYTYTGEHVSTSMDTLGDLGSGIYHSDTFQKYEQILYLEFGVPKFASMFEILQSMVSREELIAATKGGSATAYQVGKGIAEGVLLFYRFVPFIIGSAIKFVVGSVLDGGQVDYYTLKPTMHNYLVTASKIWQQFGVELGVITPMKDATKGQDEQIGIPLQLNSESFKEFAEYYPQAISKVPGIDKYYLDIFKLVASSYRDTRYKMDVINRLIETAEKGSDDEILESFISRTTIEGKDSKNNPRTMLTFYESIVGDIMAYNNLDEKKEEDGKTAKEKAEEDKISYLRSMADYALLSLSNGSKFIPLTVNYVGETTYSWSNSVGEIGLEGMLNSGSTFIEDKKFSSFGGNIFGDIVTDIISAGKDALLGGLDGLTFGVSDIINSLLTGGRMTLPKKYTDSSNQFPKHTFEIPLVSVSGDPMVQLTTTYLQISLLLAGTLPRSIGNTNYVSPYLCSAYLRGITNIKLGMIDSLEVKFGTGKMGRNDFGRSVSTTITFSIVDMSEMVTVKTPVPSKVLSIFHNDNDPLNLFIRTAVGSSLVRESSTQSIFGGPAILARVSKAFSETAGITSEARLGSKFEEFIPWWRSSSYEKSLESLSTGGRF